MKVIVFSGKAGSGKSTLAQILNGASNSVLLKHATPLYRFMEAFNKDKNRPFLVKAGELAKEFYGSECFAEAMLNQINQCRENNVELALIDDLRFHGELSSLYTNVDNLLTVRLNCDESKLDDRVSAPADRTHVSEIDLDDAQFDLVLDTGILSVEECLKIILKEARIWSD